MKPNMDSFDFSFDLRWTDRYELWHFSKKCWCVFVLGSLCLSIFPPFLLALRPTHQSCQSGSFTTSFAVLSFPAIFVSVRPMTYNIFQVESGPCLRMFLPFFRNPPAGKYFAKKTPKNAQRGKNFSKLTKFPELIVSTS